MCSNFENTYVSPRMSDILVEKFNSNSLKTQGIINNPIKDLNIEELRAEYIKSLSYIEILQNEKANLKNTLQQIYAKNTDNSTESKKMNPGLQSSSYKPSVPLITINDYELQIKELYQENKQLKKFIDNQTSFINKMQTDIKNNQEKLKDLDKIQALNTQLENKIVEMDQQIIEINKKMKDLENENNQFQAIAKKREDILETISNYYNYLTYILKDFDEDHYVKHCFCERFILNTDTIKEINDKDCESLCLKAYKYLADIVINIHTIMKRNKDIGIIINDKKDLNILIKSSKERKFNGDIDDNNGYSIVNDNNIDDNDENNNNNKDISQDNKLNEDINYMEQFQEKYNRLQNNLNNEIKKNKSNDSITIGNNDNNQSKEIIQKPIVKNSIDSKFLSPKVENFLNQHDIAKNNIRPSNIVDKSNIRLSQSINNDDQIQKALLEVDNHPIQLKNQQKQQVPQHPQQQISKNPQESLSRLNMPQIQNLKESPIWTGVSATNHSSYRSQGPFQPVINNNKNETDDKSYGSNFFNINNTHIQEDSLDNIKREKSGMIKNNQLQGVLQLNGNNNQRIINKGNLVFNPGNEANANANAGNTNNKNIINPSDNHSKDEIKTENSDLSSQIQFNLQRIFEKEKECDELRSEQFKSMSLSNKELVSKFGQISMQYNLPQNDEVIKGKYDQKEEDFDEDNSQPAWKLIMCDNKKIKDLNERELIDTSENMIANGSDLDRRLSKARSTKSNPQNKGSIDNKSFKVTFGRTETLNPKKKSNGPDYCTKSSHNYIIDIPHKKIISTVQQPTMKYLLQSPDSSFSPNRLKTNKPDIKSPKEYSSNPLVTTLSPRANQNSNIFVLPLSPTSGNQNENSQNPENNQVSQG